MTLKRVKAGDAITAGMMNALIDVANLPDVTVAQGCGLGMDRGIIYAAFAAPVWVKITGPISGGVYPFTQQLPAASGAWTNGPLTGNAYEANGNTSVATGTIALAEKLPSGDWRFQMGNC